MDKIREDAKREGLGKKLTAADLARIGMMTALIAVCAWVTIPMTIPFTLQTFGVFAALLLLEGRKGTIAIALYILVGFAGVPVFSGFGAGPAVLAGPTGGYIVGFLLTGLLYWVTGAVRKNRRHNLLVLVGGLALCYLFGTIWFLIVMGSRGNSISFFSALGICVVPYILPDLAKLFAADLVAGRLRKALHL